MRKDTAVDVTGEIGSALRAWRTSVLNGLLATAAVLALPAIAVVFFQATNNPEQWPAALVFLAIYLILAGLAVFRRLDVRLRAWGLLLLGYAAGVLAFARGGLVGDGRVFLLALPVLALILAGVRSGLAMTALSLVTYVVFAVFARLGWLENWLIVTDNSLALTDWLSAGTGMVMLLVPVVVLLWHLIRFQTRTMEAERQAAMGLAQTSDLLRERAEELEEANRLLAERTEALAAATEVAQQIASLTDEQDLIEQFINLIGERFGLYHAGLFTLDAQKEQAVLRIASSEGGQRMTRRGYQVRVGAADAVGQAAQSGQGHLSAAIPASLPDLPQTQWRLALPLQVSGATIGVLDVHFDDEQPPSEDRVQVLRTLANQLATRLENVQLLAQTQASLEELRSLYRATTAEAWERFIKVQPDLNHYQAGEAEVPEETWKSLFAQARSLAQPVTAEVKGDGRFALAVPVKLRGVPIGVMGFHRPLEAGEWQPEEIALAAGAAERVALALENVRLLEETQRRAREEHLLGEVTARIRAPMDVDTILQTAVRELGRAMGVDRVSVYLAPEEETA